jgi:hypothetical protein
MTLRLVWRVVVLSIFAWLVISGSQPNQDTALKDAG